MIDIDLMTAATHQANAPLLTSQITQTRTDLKIKLVQQVTANLRVVFSVWNHNRIQLRKTPRRCNCKIEPQSR